MPETNPQLPQAYRIGLAAELSGVSAANIRYYEQEKLIGRRGTGDSSYRIYSESDVHQLRFIRLLRSMDMSLDEVRALLGLDFRRKADCALADEALDSHIQHVRERLRELRALERQLVGLRKVCDGAHPHCRLIEALHRQAEQANIARTGPGASRKRHV